MSYRGLVEIAGRIGADEVYLTRMVSSVQDWPSKTSQYIVIFAQKPLR